MNKERRLVVSPSDSYAKRANQLMLAALQYAENHESIFLYVFPSIFLDRIGYANSFFASIE